MNRTDKLIALLEQNADLYEQLMAAVEEENLAIQRCDMPRTGELVKEKEKLSGQLKTVDAARKTLLAEIASSIGENADTLTIDQLADRAENRPVRARMMTVREKLLKYAADIREKNEFNRRLIGRAMNTIKETLRFSNALIGGNGDTYSNGKRVEGKMPSGMVVTRSY
jgi:flagellar biosynthesis/type III secretory pathway chaperone